LREEKLTVPRSVDVAARPSQLHSLGFHEPLSRQKRSVSTGLLWFCENKRGFHDE